MVGHTETIAFLLHGRSDATRKADQYQLTAIHHISQGKCPKALALLMDPCAEFNAPAAGFNEPTPLQWVAAFIAPAVVAAALLDARADLHASYEFN